MHDALPMLDVLGISHRFADGSVVLEDVSFAVGRGERVVLLGANGSGKSTLLRVLNGLIHPSAGRYVYDQCEVSSATLRDRAFVKRFRREVVLLFQNPDSMLFNPTVLDEIAFGPRQLGMEDADARARGWAERLGVATHLARPPFALSSGEKQRVCLAALLVLEPKVLLLDEPTASLDPRSVGLLVDLLEEIGATTIVTTHNLSLAPELGDRGLVLSESHRLLYDGPVETLVEDTATLESANLVHTHVHKHAGSAHTHQHRHDWRG